MEWAVKLCIKISSEIMDVGGVVLLVDAQWDATIPWFMDILVSFIIHYKNLQWKKGSII